MAIANDAGPKVSGRELFPEVIVMTGQHSMAAVAEMRAQSRTGRDGFSNSCRTGRGVPQRNDHIGLHELLDEGIIGEDAMARYFDYDAFGHDIRMDFNEEEDEATEGLSDKEVGEWYIDQTGEDQMVEIVKGNSYYFDTKAFARDLDYNSEVEEFTFDGTTYTVTNMLGL